MTSHRDLPDSTAVWRYMDMWKFMSLLESDCLFFARLDTMEDPFDGQLRPYELAYAKRLVESALSDNPKALNKFSSASDKYLRQGVTKQFGPVFISCWHVANQSNYAMWKLYCPSGQGVAIVSTMGQLRQLATSHSLDLRQVEYLSVRELGRVDKWDELPFLKRYEYEFEKEVRMVIRHPLTTYLEGDSENVGIRVPLNIQEAIEKVWVPAGGSEWQKKALEVLLSKYGIKLEVGRSKIMDDYWGDEAKIGDAVLLNQFMQLRNPDSRIILDPVPTGNLFSSFANSYVGFQNGDTPRWLIAFWEIPSVIYPWNRLQNTTNHTTEFSGCNGLIKWADGQGEMAENPQVLVKGTSAWKKDGVLVRLTGDLPCCLYKGQIYDQSSATLIPKEPSHLSAIWCFCASSEFNKAVRIIDQKRNVTNATLVKIPFDLSHWQKIAAELYPDGLPDPHSDDPTQWLFLGDIPSSTDPLQVAMARLLGFRWPDQSADALDIHTAEDGIATLAPLVHQEGLASRLRKLLQAAYESEVPIRPKGAPAVVEAREWNENVIPRLLAKDGSIGMVLEEWLRDKFFAKHTKLFQDRDVRKPFIWHIWDERKDGFHAFVNYHKLDLKNLERLTHVYLGDWIERQKAALDAGDVAAEGRLIAAQKLQTKLELIRVGEIPYDIFVRWKKLHEQPIGWDPDLNDGVRINIRPFVEANILRETVNVNWKDDKGKDQEPNVGGTLERRNDRHFALAVKQAAREGQKHS